MKRTNPEPVFIGLNTKRPRISAKVAAVAAATTYVPLLDDFPDVRAILYPYFNFSDFAVLARTCAAWYKELVDLLWVPLMWRAELGARRQLYRALETTNNKYVKSIYPGWIVSAEYVNMCGFLQTVARPLRLFEDMHSPTTAMRLAYQTHWPVGFYVMEVGGALEQLYCVPLNANNKHAPTLKQGRKFMARINWAQIMKVPATMKKYVPVDVVDAYFEARRANTEALSEHTAQMSMFQRYMKNFSVTRDTVNDNSLHDKMVAVQRAKAADDAAHATFKAIKRQVKDVLRTHNIAKEFF